MAVGRGEGLGIFDVVGVQAGGDLRGAEDEGGARRAAHGSGCVGACVAATLGGEAVKVRGFHVAQAVGSGVGRHVVGDDPDDVRFRQAHRRRRRRGGGEERRREIERGRSAARRARGAFIWVIRCTQNLVTCRVCDGMSETRERRLILKVSTLTHEQCGVSSGDSDQRESFSNRLSQADTEENN